MTQIPGAEIYVLDIDGTLMHTHEIDNSCYWQAVYEVFGVRGSDGDLDHFRHVTDSGILQEWCRRLLDREPRATEISRIRKLFLDLMRGMSVERPELFMPRPGLEAWLESIAGDPGRHLAVATGSWRNTAEFKLEVAGLDRFGLPLATADDAVRRTDIMGIAVSRLDLPRPAAEYRITYVGDGPWDLEASRLLGWSFIGIAAGARARTLRELGAERVDTDFVQLARHHGTLAG